MPRGCHSICRLALLWAFGLLVVPIAGSAATYNVEVMHSLTYTTPAGCAPLHLDLYRPMQLPGALPTVLAIHGGFWRSGDRTQLRDICGFFASRGFAAVSIDYRLAPAYHYPAPLDDVCAAARWIQAQAATYHFDQQHLFAFGASSGAQLGALLVMKHPPTCPHIAGVIDVFGPMDFTVLPPNPFAQLIVEDYLGTSQQQNPYLFADASPITHVQAGLPPFLIIQDPKDPVVPFAQSLAMQAALKNAHIPVSFCPCSGLGHAAPDLRTPVGMQLLDALMQFLQPPTH